MSSKNDSQYVSCFRVRFFCKNLQKMANKNNSKTVEEEEKTDGTVGY